MKKIVFIVSAAMAIATTGLATSHFTHSSQSPGNVAGVPGLNYVSGPTLAEVDPKVWLKRENESELAFAGRISRQVHNSTYHCSPTEFTLSPVETVLSTALQIFTFGTDVFGWNQGLLSMNRLVCGFCHQRAYFVAKVLRDNGIDAKTYGLTGHVVTHFAADGRQWLVDPDYDVPPLQYDVDPESLLSAATDRYEVASWSNQLMVANMIATKSDNGPYYSNEYLDTLVQRRAALFFIADIVAAALAMAAIAGSTAALVWQRTGAGNRPSRQHT